MNGVFTDHIDTIEDLSTKVFYCPGCKCYHYINPKNFTISGPPESPTVRPSIRVVFHSLIKGIEIKCHLSIANGHMEYSGKCKHRFAGKTVKMEAIKRNEFP